MWSIIQEFVISVIVFVLICLITFSNRQQNSFYEVQHLQNYFFNTRQIDCDYTQVFSFEFFSKKIRFLFLKILTIDDYWEWLENSFVVNLRAQQWYNGEIPEYLNGFINDKTNRLIGWASMRQLRTNLKLCSDHRIISECEYDYSLFNEEKESFEPGWTTNTTENEEYSSSILKAFQYQLSENIDTYTYIGDHGTYSGNGYVYEFRGSLLDLRSNLSKLHQLEWIDENTRAVLIQMTLYNPNVQLFTSIILLCEFLSTGGVFPSAEFQPIEFYGK
jgi:polycystin 1L2